MMSLPCCCYLTLSSQCRLVVKSVFFSKVFHVWWIILSTAVFLLTSYGHPKYMVDPQTDSKYWQERREMALDRVKKKPKTFPSMLHCLPKNSETHRSPFSFALKARLD